MNKIQKVTVFAMAVVAALMFAGQIAMNSDNSAYAFIRFHGGFHHGFHGGFHRFH